MAPKMTDDNLAGEITSKATKVMNALVNLLSESPGITAEQALESLRAQLSLVLASYDLELVIDPACVTEHEANDEGPQRVAVRAVLETELAAGKVHIRAATEDQMQLAHQVAHWRDAIRLFLSAAQVMDKYDLAVLLERGQSALLQAFEEGHSAVSVARIQADVNVVRAAKAYVGTINAQVPKQ